jgi:two-component system, OmpR family, sensor histidine kinase KdpD
MQETTAVTWRWTLSQTAIGCLGAAALTVLAYRLDLNYATVGFLYLLLVVVQSLAGSFLPAAVVSVIAMASLDYFFIPPKLSWRFAEPRDILALGTCLVTALVITRLASAARTQAFTAEQHRKKLALLFQAASRLLALDPEDAAERCPSIFREAFGFDGVCVFDGVSVQTHLAGNFSENLVEATRAAYLRDRDLADPQPGTLVHCLRVAGKTIGAIGFEGRAGSSAVTSPLSVLAASIVERTHTFERSIKAEAEMRAEALRSAILDAFAHEFKTPLTAILAAAGGLYEVGELNAAQFRLVEIVETETSRLGSLTTRLLRMARVDKGEVTPRLQPTDLGLLVADLVRRRAGVPEAPSLSVEFLQERVMVMADPELLTMAVIPLLDNALKYARAGSIPVVEVDRDRGEGVLRVRNHGSFIDAADARKIFERFYRGARGNSVEPGTGLGLYIAKKIAVAHGGTLELEPERLAAGVATFCMRLPGVPVAEVEYGIGLP